MNLGSHLPHSGLLPKTTITKRPLHRGSNIESKHHARDEERNPPPIDDNLARSADEFEDDVAADTSDPEQDDEAPYDLDDENNEVVASPVAPFEPPANFAFEPELSAPVPRAIPLELRRGLLASRRTLGAWFSATLGLLLTLAGMTDVVAQWSLYLPFLAWMQWVGIALVGVAGYTQIRSLSTGGNYRYFVEGTPTVCLIDSIFSHRVDSSDSTEGFYQYVARIRYRHVDPNEPEAGEQIISERVESNTYTKGMLSELECRYEAGEYVTGLLLPDKPIQLYGFLELHPEIGIVHREEKAKEISPRTLGIVAAASLVLIGTMIGWCVWSYAKYYPLEFTFEGAKKPMLVGALFLGTWQLLYKLSEVIRGKGRPVGEIIGMVTTSSLFGAGLGVALSFAVNALADTGAVEKRPVVVTFSEDKTWSVGPLAYSRKVEVTYRLPGDEKPRRLFVTPETVASLKPGDAVAHVRPGYLGWKWIETITND